MIGFIADFDVPFIFEAKWRNKSDYYDALREASRCFPLINQFAFALRVPI
jgi:hypothetical protein